MNLFSLFNIKQKMAKKIIKETVVEPVVEILPIKPIKAKN